MPTATIDEAEINRRIQAAVASALLLADKEDQIAKLKKSAESSESTRRAVLEYPMKEDDVIDTGSQQEEELQRTRLNSARGAMYTNK